MTVTRLRDPLQPFVFLPVSLIGDFDFSIEGATVGNSGIISPLNCNPMSVKMALNISQHFIIFLPVFIFFSIKVTVQVIWREFLPPGTKGTLRTCHDLNSSNDINKFDDTFVFFSINRG